MNDRDYENLQFLLSIDEAGFDLWLQQASDDDCVYALELLKQSKSVRMLKALEQLDLEDLDTTLANTVINEIKSKK